MAGARLRVEQDAGDRRGLLAGQVDGDALADAAIPAGGRRDQTIDQLPLGVRATRFGVKGRLPAQPLPGQVETAERARRRWSKCGWG